MIDFDNGDNLLSLAPVKNDAQIALREALQSRVGKKAVVIDPKVNAIRIFSLLSPIHHLSFME